MVCSSLAQGRASGHGEWVWVERPGQGTFRGAPPTPWGARRATLARRRQAVRAGGARPPSGGVLCVGPPGPHAAASGPGSWQDVLGPQAGTCHASAGVRGSANHSDEPAAFLNHANVPQTRKVPRPLLCSLRTPNHRASACSAWSLGLSGEPWPWHCQHFGASPGTQRWPVHLRGCAFC